MVAVHRMDGRHGTAGAWVGRWGFHLLLWWMWVGVARDLIGRGQTSDLETLGSLDQAGQLGLGNRGLPFVHKVHDALDLPPSDVLEDNDRMFARVVDKYFLKIGAVMEQEEEDKSC